MHIAINGWFGGRSTTGSGQYLHHLLDHLPQQAPEIRISLLLPQAGAGGPTPPTWSSVETVPVSVPAWSENWRKLWWEQVAVPRAARRLAADLLWIPYWAAPYWQPLPVCVTVHDLIPLLLPAYRGRLPHRLYTALVGKTARRAAAILTVSHASARDIARHLHIPPDRIHVVYHGPNRPEAPSSDAATLEAVRAKFALPERYFLYLGGFDVRKNLAATFAAYRRYLDLGGDPAVKLVIAGSLPAADTAFTPDPRRLAVEQGLDGQVHWCGWIDERDKAAVYALATAFVFPSLYEGFGMMVLEAMAAGTPVITSLTTA